MPGGRRLRFGALLAVLFVLVLLYTTTAKRSTYSSQFYSRTMAAMSERRSTKDQADILAGEKSRQDRVSKIQGEHDAAMQKASDPDKQKPIVDDVYRVPPSPSVAPDEAGMQPVTGRKTKDGKVVVDENGKGTDGVAKVGNVQAKEGNKDAATKKKDTGDEAKAEDEINDILKKGPVIIFSKTFCPYSKKAKNILQNLYTIVPPPHVVELDTHSMGAALQASLGKSTGRSTVPNILVNGKSIGGGDDIEALHLDGKLIETIQNLAGKRVVEIKKASDSASQPKQPRHLRA